MARINSAGVFIELIAAVVLIVLFAVHITRGPQVVFETQGHGRAATTRLPRRLPGRLAGVGLRHVRLRHRELARRGDPRPAPQRAARHHPGDLASFVLGG